MLTVRLASTGQDIEAAQALRYKVFRGSTAAGNGCCGIVQPLDRDRFDAHCDHLLVETATGEVVGTYRLLRQDTAARLGGFYSEQEFEISPLLERHPALEFVELGRSCVHPDWRSRKVVERLWHGIWDYVRQHDISVLFGCASLPGTNLDQHAQALSFLARNYSAPENWRARAVPHRYRQMNILAGRCRDEQKVERTLPPLIKAYLRAGARVGDGAVIDEDLGTTDVLVVLPVACIAPRYLDRFAVRRAAGTAAVQPLMS